MRQKRRLKSKNTHFGELWAKVYRIIKVEEPITFEMLRKWLPDVPISDLDFTLLEMENAGRIAVEREWKNGRLKLSYSYR